MDLDELLERLDKVVAADLLETESLLAERESLTDTLLAVAAELRGSRDEEATAIRRDLRDAVDCLNAMGLSAYPQTASEEGAYMAEAARHAREGLRRYRARAED